MIYQMLRRILPLVFLCVLCVVSAPTAYADATIYTDRAAFIAASQNLRSYDFQDQPLSRDGSPLVIDGITFEVSAGAVGISLDGCCNKVVRGGTGGEVSQMIVRLPAGTTAVGFEQFSSLSVQVSVGGGFVFPNPGPTFVGFISDIPIGSFWFSGSATGGGTVADVVLDNLLVGQKKPTFDFCIQDDSSGKVLRLNSATGEYEFSICGGISLRGMGMLIRKGNIITLQHYGNDRRVVVRIDASGNRATAFIQAFSLGTTFTITDRDTSHGTCSCP